jgi:hypothetical protein
MFLPQKNPQILPHLIRSCAMEVTMKTTEANLSAIKKSLVHLNVTLICMAARQDYMLADLKKDDNGSHAHHDNHATAHAWSSNRATYK